MFRTTLAARQVLCSGCYAITGSLQHGFCPLLLLQQCLLSQWLRPIPAGCQQGISNERLCTQGGLKSCKDADTELGSANKPCSGVEMMANASFTKLMSGWVLPGAG